MSPRQPQSSPLVATHGQLADVLGLNDEPASREMVFWQQSLADYVEKIAAIEKPSTPAVRRKFYDADGKLKPAAAERLADLQGKRNRLLAGIKQMDAQRQSRKLQTSKADVVIAFGPSDLLNFLHHSEGELLAHIYDLRNAKPAQMEGRRRAAILFSNFVEQAIAPMAVGCNWRGQPGQVWFRLAAEQLRAFARGDISDPDALDAMTRLEMKLDLIAMKVGVSPATLRQVVEAPDQIYGVLSRFYRETERASELTSYFQQTYAKPGHNAPKAKGIGESPHER